MQRANLRIEEAVGVGSVGRALVQAIVAAAWIVHVAVAEHRCKEREQTNKA